MTALALREPAGLRTDREPDPRRLGAGQGAATLDEVVAAAWAQLQAGLDATCPVCVGALRPVPTAGSRSGGGRCRSCGSALA